MFPWLVFILYPGTTSFRELVFCAGKTEVPQEKKTLKARRDLTQIGCHIGMKCRPYCREASPVKTAPSLPLQSTLSQSKAYLTLTLVKRYFGSNFLAKSMESYIRAKPVLLPPPKAVLKPKQKITSAVVLYTLASFSRISAFETFGLPGWRTSTT